jgi:hypothetical protein
MSCVYSGSLRSFISTSSQRDNLFSHVDTPVRSAHCWISARPQACRGRLTIKITKGSARSSSCSLSCASSTTSSCIRRSNGSLPKSNTRIASRGRYRWVIRASLSRPRNRSKRPPKAESGCSRTVLSAGIISTYPRSWRTPAILRHGKRSYWASTM